MTIKILDFKKYEKGFLYGFADIAVPLWGTNMIIRGCKIFNKEGRQWVNLPSREYEKDGETKYAPIIALEDDAVYKQFTTGLTTAWNEYVREQQEAPPQAPIEAAPTDNFGGAGVPF